MNENENEKGGGRISVFQKKIAELKLKLNLLLQMLPKPKLYVTDYRKLARSIARLREEKVLLGSVWLIVKCCMFIFIFTEQDFTKWRFGKLIENAEPENDGDSIKKD